MTINRQIRLKNRPQGLPNETHFETVDMELPLLGEHEVTVKTSYISVDPYMRGRMNDRKSYAAPAQLGQVFGGGAIGEVVDSNSASFQKGDFVGGGWGWQTFANVEADKLTKLDPAQAPITTALGVLGMPGLTAYFGMLDIGKPKSGETVVISGAAGAVGSIAGQIAKIQGATVIGIAGTDEKNDYLCNQLGFDAAINYRTSSNLLADLQQAAPNGVDVYFDNVGGSISDAVLSLINRGARIPVCGQISLYNLEQPELGPRIGPLLLSNTALMQGFLYGQYASRLAEGREQMGEWVRANKISYAEHIVEGFDQTVQAFLALFAGDNIGKLLVKI